MGIPPLATVSSSVRRILSKGLQRVIGGGATLGPEPALRGGVVVERLCHLVLRIAHGRDEVVDGELECATAFELFAVLPPIAAGLVVDDAQTLGTGGDVDPIDEAFQCHPASASKLELDSSELLLELRRGEAVFGRRFALKELVEVGAHPRGHRFEELVVGDAPSSYDLCELLVDELAGAGLRRREVLRCERESLFVTQLAEQRGDYVVEHAAKVCGLKRKQPARLLPLSKMEPSRQKILVGAGRQRLDRRR